MTMVGRCVSDCASAIAPSMRSEIVHVGDVQHLPTVGLEALGGIVGEREIGRSVDRDLVVVVESDQLAESVVTGRSLRLRVEMPSIRSPSLHMKYV